MRGLLQEVNAWILSQPPEVIAYFGEKRNVSMKALVTIKQKLDAFWKEEGSFEDVAAWLQGQLTEELAQKSADLIKGLAHKVTKRTAHKGW